MKKSIKKAIVKFKVVRKINQEVKESFTSMIGNRILLKMKQTFDPYTSEVYDELLNEQYKEVKDNFDCAIKCYKFIDSTINDLMD